MLIASDTYFERIARRRSPLTGMRSDTNTALTSSGDKTPFLQTHATVDFAQLLLCDGNEVLEGDRLVPSVLVVAGHCGHLVVTHLTTGHLHEQGMQALVVRRWLSVRLHELVHLALGQSLQPLHDHLDVGDWVLQQTTQVRQVEVRQVKVRQVEARQVKVRQVKVRQVEVRQVKVRQVNVRQVEVRQVQVRQVEARQVKVRQVKVRQVNVRQVKVRQVKVRQVKVRQVQMRQV
ncbi:hypothetical protein NP493_67g03044 [Ridgeia piscesae]|uniref:Uncharacterized protein n=1 Tax=Ridgeia piscesae TaxID=27915 RepID=A0AAD9PA66_RIDPI|nr:hypothetical protein NP493_67g03044 [Ridgeia piscesae]